MSGAEARPGWPSGKNTRFSSLAVTMRAASSTLLKSNPMALAEAAPPDVIAATLPVVTFREYTVSVAPR
jgi:hypothetical protein